MPTDTAPVLLRIPHDPDWEWAEFPIEPAGFHYKVLQQMGGGRKYESYPMDDDFSLVCDEEGSFKDPTPCCRVKIRNGAVITLVGRVAIVRFNEARSNFVGLHKPADLTLVKTRFEWFPV